MPITFCNIQVGKEYSRPELAQIWGYRGYQARHNAQEHSYVQDMWKQISNPDILIYLDVSFEISMKRTDSNWSRVIYDNQIQRLVHAKKHTDLYINTDDLSTEQVLELVLENLQDVVTQ